jgi:hypothetical protein
MTAIKYVKPERISLLKHPEDAPSEFLEDLRA